MSPVGYASGKRAKHLLRAIFPPLVRPLRDEQRTAEARVVREPVGRKERLDLAEPLDRYFRVLATSRLRTGVERGNEIRILLACGHGVAPNVELRGLLRRGVRSRDGDLARRRAARLSEPRLRARKHVSAHSRRARPAPDALARDRQAHRSRRNPSPEGPTARKRACVAPEESASFGASTTTRVTAS